jgi:hypothetical protein
MLEQGVEKVLRLAEGLALDGTKTFHSLYQGRKLLLEGEWGHGKGGSRGRWAQVMLSFANPVSAPSGSGKPR